MELIYSNIQAILKNVCLELPLGSFQTQKGGRDFFFSNWKFSLLKNGKKNYNLHKKWKLKAKGFAPK